MNPSREYLQRCSDQSGYRIGPVVVEVREGALLEVGGALFVFGDEAGVTDGSDGRGRGRPRQTLP